MNVKEAVRTAKDYLVDVMDEERIRDVGLEEVRFDEIANKWEVTLGFSRPWDRRHGTGIIGQRPRQAGRSYKILSVNDSNGQVESLKDRILETPHAI